MSYGLNVYTDKRLALTSQLPATMLLTVTSHSIAPVSITVSSTIPPIVFVQCTNGDVAYSVPRITKTGGDDWVVSFDPLPYLLHSAGLVSSVGASGTFRLFVFGAKHPVTATGYGSILNTANLSAGPLAVDGHLHLDLNAASYPGLPVTSHSGRSVVFPGASETAICSHLGYNSFDGSYMKTALDTSHPVAGIPLGFGVKSNRVMSFQGFRDNALQPRQYPDYWDIMLINVNKYV